MTQSQTHESQTQKRQQSSSKYTLRVNADEVVLNCTVLESKGRLVDGLQRDNFRAWHDKKPQQLISVQQSDSPVSIGLFVDNSGSMRTRRAAVTEAALDLLRASNP